MTVASHPSKITKYPHLKWSVSGSEVDPVMSRTWCKARSSITFYKDMPFRVGPKRVYLNNRRNVLQAV